MSRPSWQTICMNIAHEIAKRSYDEKMKVGCVIVSSDYRQVYSWGFNGNASGLPNKRDSLESGKSGFIHAELNACISCSVHRSFPKIVFCTHLPCKDCSKALIQLGVIEVYYKEDYPLDQTALTILPQCGIKIMRV